ncbi:MAG: hypothetical protein AAGA42_06265 [Actinomycetota bacterium]
MLTQHVVQRLRTSFAGRVAVQSAAVVLLSVVGSTLSAEATSSPATLLAGIDLVGYSAVFDPSIPTHDLTYGEFLDLADAAPELYPPEDDVANFRGAVRLWLGPSDDVVVVSAATFGDRLSASAIVDGAVEAGERSGTELDPPFADARSFLSTADGIDTATVVWTQGDYALIISHLAAEGNHRELRVDTIAQRVEMDVRRQVGESPTAPTTADNRGIAYRIGYTLGPLLLAPLIAIPIVWFERRRRRRLASATPLPPPAQWPAPTHDHTR